MKRISIIATCGLASCITPPPPELPPVPKAPRTPPSSFLAACPTLNTLATDRPVEQAEAWATVFENYGLYHDCKSRHAFLAGWISGQVSGPPEPPAEPKKRGFWPFG